MESKNDAVNHRFAAVNRMLLPGSIILGLFALIVASVGGFTSASAQPVDINGNICSGGNRNPALIAITPADGAATINQALSLDMTVDWVDSVTVKRGGTTLGTASGNNTSNQTVSVPITLIEGTNNLTISLTGGCPTNTADATYSLTYIENATTFTYKLTNIRSPRLLGNFKPLGSKVFLTVAGNTYEATTKPDGSWELPAGTIAPDLLEGSYDIYVEQKDSNDVAVFSRTYTDALVIDTTAPMGSISSHFSTSRSPELKGIVNDPEAEVQISLNGVIYPAVNNRDGTWAIAAGTIAPELASGDYEIILTITDKAGNVTTASSTMTIQADNELGFILAPNTGYLRINSINIPSWIFYALLSFTVLFFALRKFKQADQTAQ